MHYYSGYFEIIFFKVNNGPNISVNSVKPRQIFTEILQCKLDVSFF